MNERTRFGGVAIVVAVLLMITRMIPIFAGGIVAPADFPPDTAAATATLAVEARAGWEISHWMLLAALLLFFVGYAMLAAELTRRGRRLGLPALVVLATGLLLFAVAGVIDGFLVPVIAARQGLLADVPADSIPAFVALGHELALAFFGQAQTAIVLGIGLVAVALLQARLLNRWLVASGAALSMLTLAGLAAGLFGGHWRAFTTTGPVLMLFYLWQLALGIGMVRSRVVTVAAERPRIQEQPA